MKFEGTEIKTTDLSKAFPTFFDNKLKKIVQPCKVDNKVHNGCRKVYCRDLKFMTVDNVAKAIKSMKSRTVKAMTESLNLL